MNMFHSINNLKGVLVEDINSEIRIVASRYRFTDVNSFRLELVRPIVDRLLKYGLTVEKFYVKVGEPAHKQTDLYEKLLREQYETLKAKAIAEVEYKEAVAERDRAQAEYQELLRAALEEAEAATQPSPASQPK